MNASSVKDVLIGKYGNSRTLDRLLIVEPEENLANFDPFLRKLNEEEVNIDPFRTIVDLEGNEW